MRSCRGGAGCDQGAGRAVGGDATVGVCHGWRGRSCAAAGAELDATQVLDALSEEMPLAVAVDIVGRMLRTAIHARRSAAIVRNLHRSLHLSTAAERAEVHPFSESPEHHFPLRQSAVEALLAACLHALVYFSCKLPPSVSFYPMKQHIHVASDGEVVTEFS